MATDVSRMSAAELDKLNAKIEKRRQELAKQEALKQMQAVAKHHGVDFAEIARLHSAKLPKAPTKTARKATAKTAVKAAPKAKSKTSAKAASKVMAKTEAQKANPKAVVKTTAKLKARTATTKSQKNEPKSAVSGTVISKAKYKNPDNSEQVWSGMGRKPGWFIAHLQAGKSPESMTA